MTDKVAPPSASSVLHRDLGKAYPEAVRGEGVYLWDSAGKRYLDLCGSAAVNFIGHGNPAVLGAIAEQAKELEFVHSSQFTTPVTEEYGRELVDFAGPAFAGGRVFFTSGGSEAVETALKLARQYQVEVGQPKRFKTISRHQAYHGATLGALAASGNRRRREIYLPMVRVPEAFVHIGLPYCYRCAYKCVDCAAKYAKELELAIVESRGTVAAFIAEPVSGATLGAAAPKDGYLQRCAELCRANGVLFIADEVMTGCGRTGRNMAWEHWGPEAAPDILVLAKGLTSGYLPLGAVIANKKVVDALEQGSGGFTHGFTYNGHPLACAAGRAVLRQLKKKRLVAIADANGNTDSAGAAMKKSLEKLRESDSVGDVRGMGLLWGVEFVADKATRAPFAPEKAFAAKVAAACAERGVMVYPMQGAVDGNAGDHLLLAPPAIITAAEIEESVMLMRDSIRTVSGGLSA